MCKQSYYYQLQEIDFLPRHFVDDRKNKTKNIFREFLSLSRCVTSSSDKQNIFGSFFLEDDEICGKLKMRLNCTLTLTMTCWIYPTVVVHLMI